MYKAYTSDQEFEVAFDSEGILLDGQRFECDMTQLDESTYHLIKDNKSYTIQIEGWDPKEKKTNISINGTFYPVEVKDKLDLLLQKLGMDKLAGGQVNEVKAPMPGLILSVAVNEGDEVTKGDPLLILEAMKMENVIKSPTDGVVKSIKAGKGDSVEKNQVLVEF